MEEAPQHIILFPFLAQGHIFPFLNLAKQLEQHTRKHINNNNNNTVIITLVSTPLNIAKLRNSISNSSCIKLTELPFSGIECAESVPLNQFAPFFSATESSLRPPFENLIAGLVDHDHDQGKRKVCIIADYFLGWTVEIAERHNVPHAIFLTGGPYGTAVFISLVVHSPPHSFFLRNPPTETTVLADYPEIELPYSDVANTVPGAMDDDPSAVLMRRQLLYSFRSRAVLLNSTEELDKQGIMLLRRHPSLPVYPIGPLVRERRSLCSDRADSEEEERCIKFLDSKNPNSVLYISFGSFNTIPASQMLELARGLEASEKPFIWVIRPPSEFEEEAKEGEFREEWLLEGFEVNMTEKNHGILLHRWAPQLKILSHRSTGAFLSHCGWNSVLESLHEGVPIISWPLLADQLYTSSVLQELGVGIEIARGRVVGGLAEVDGRVVKETVEMVLEEEGNGFGRRMRERVGEIRELIRAAVRDDGDGEFVGSSCKAMAAFLQTMFSGD